MRIEILYDFDFEAFVYYEQGLNSHPSMRFSGNKKTYFPLKAIRERDSIEPLYLLGAGLDKICIIVSDDKSCFVIEPCPAMFFICQMEEVFTYFINELRRGNISPSDGGIFEMDSVFRPAGIRDIFEVHVSVSLENQNDDWIISFGKSGCEKVLNVPLIPFLSAYFEFGERMMRFYDHVLPEYREFKYQYPLFKKAVQDSIIKKEFEFKPQSSFDDKTYYDYQ